VLPEDEDLLDYWMGVDLEGDDEDLDSDSVSPWVIRFELDKEKVAGKYIQLEEIPVLIQKHFGPDTFHIMISNQNMPRQVSRQRAYGSID
jgi:hypothetical protein